jgi:phage terminase large subunit-like protein
VNNREREFRKQRPPVAAWRVQRQLAVGGAGSPRHLAGFEFEVSLVARPSCSRSTVECTEPDSREGSVVAAGGQPIRRPQLLHPLQSSQSSFKPGMHGRVKLR